MLERIPARVWIVIVLVGAFIAVVVIGQLYGSKPTACGLNPSPFAHHRQWPVAATYWVLVSAPLALVVLAFIIIARGRNPWVDYVSRPRVWLGWASVVGGWVGWFFIEGFGWTC